MIVPSGRIHNHSLGQDERDRSAQAGHGGEGNLLEGQVLPAEAEQRPEGAQQQESHDEDEQVHQGEAPECTGKGAQLILLPQC